jgi:hypothetical protein
MIPVRVLSLSVLLAAAPTVLVVCGCSDDAHIQARAVHASSTAPNVDVKIGSTFIAQNLPFGSASSYARAKAGSGTVNVYAAGSDSNAVLSAPVTAVKNSVLTVFALGELSNIKGVVKVESASDAATPASGQAKLRAVHGAFTAGTVDVYITAPGTKLTGSVTPTLSQFTFGSVTSYLSVPAGAYQVQITATGTQSPVLINIPSVTLTAGQLYTAIAVDATSAPNSAPSVVLINDPALPTGSF